jgi:hypothetical protein
MADETSLREDIAAAMEAVEKPAEPVTEPTPAEVVPSEPIGGKADEEKPRDDKGRFASKIGDKPAEKQKELALPPVEAKTEPPPTEAKPPEEAPKPVEPERPKVRAPASWKPTAREGWDKLPPDVQQEVIRREREISHTLNETAEARQTHQKFKETIAPYEAMIRADGGEPIQAVGTLLRTAAALATGAAPMRAQIIANLITTYGVDIPTLGELLSGQSPQQVVQPQYQQPDPRQFRDPRLDALLEQQSVRVQQQAADALGEIEQEEFFDDVRQDMADLLEVASRRGVALSARDAYNRAVALHPDVSRVLEQRRAAATQGATQRAMAASSSVRAQPATGPTVQSGGTLRDDLEAAFEKLQSRRT